jgi:signal peptidase I
MKLIKIVFIYLILPIILFGLPEIEKMPKNAAWGEVANWTSKGKNFITGIVGTKTNSMAPYLNGGEILLMESGTDPNKIQIGDLIVIGRWDKPHGVCHTVTEISKTHIKTQGMNCFYSDGWKEKKYVKRVVRRVIRIE